MIISHCRARLRLCMTAAASAGRAPIEPHRCILRVTNCCRVGNLPAYLPACLQSSTGLVRWCAYCWDLYHYNVIIIHSSSYCDPEIQVKAPRFTAHSGRCQAASCLDRMSSASETDVQIYMWYYGTKLSDDISPLRSMYVLGSGHSPDHHRRIRWVAEDLFTCLPEQQPIYTCISASPRSQSDGNISEIRRCRNSGQSTRAELLCTSVFVVVAYKAFKCCIQIILVADWLAGPWL